MAIGMSWWWNWGGRQDIKGNRRGRRSVDIRWLVLLVKSCLMKWWSRGRLFNNVQWRDNSGWNNGWNSRHWFNEGTGSVSRLCRRTPRTCRSIIGFECLDRGARGYCRSRKTWGWRAQSIILCQMDGIRRGRQQIVILKIGMRRRGS